MVDIQFPESISKILENIKYISCFCRNLDLLYRFIVGCWTNSFRIHKNCFFNCTCMTIKNFDWFLKRQNRSQWSELEYWFWLRKIKNNLLVLSHHKFWAIFHWIQLITILCLSKKNQQNVRYVYARMFVIQRPYLHPIILL